MPVCHRLRWEFLTIPEFVGITQTSSRYVTVRSILFAPTSVELSNDEAIRDDRRQTRHNITFETRVFFTLKLVENIIIL